jgi:hypothetical protein
MMTVAILTVYTDNFKPLADIVIPNMERYCVKHGYSLYAYDITGTDIYYGYKKIEKLLSILDTDDIDIVLVLDLDTLITNHNTRIESFVDEIHDFFICQDVNGINAGAFIIKNTNWSINFLRLVLSKQNEYECEQNIFEAFAKLLCNNSKIKILEHPSINSLFYSEYAPTWGIIVGSMSEKPAHKEGDWQKGDFILHLPGIPLERRVEIFNNIEKDIIL